jgi:hypothetical protein
MGFNRGNPVVCALLGDTAKSASILADLKRENPDNVEWQTVFAPQVLAMQEVQQNRAAEAIQLNRCAG